MPPYDDWNQIDEEEDEELQDSSVGLPNEIGGVTCELILLQAFESKRDVILFCIDCSPSMLKLYDDPNYEDAQTCHLYTALDSAVQIQKRKILVGPNDSVGILLFNTVRSCLNEQSLFTKILPLCQDKKG